MSKKIGLVLLLTILNSSVFGMHSFLKVLPFVAGGIGCYTGYRIKEKKRLGALNESMERGDLLSFESLLKSKDVLRENKYKWFKKNNSSSEVPFLMQLIRKCEDDKKVSAMIEHAIKVGADVNEKRIGFCEKENKDLLLCATKLKRKELVDDLINKFNCDETSSCPIGDWRAKGASPFLISVREAAKNNDFDLVKIYLKKGVDINKNDYESKTALTIAVENSNTGLVKLLLEYKPKIWSGVNVLGETTFSKAIRSGNFDIVKLLIDNGADVNRTFGLALYGSITPLQYALDYGRYRMATYLLLRVANPFVKSVYYVNVEYDENGAFCDYEEKTIFDMLCLRNLLKDYLPEDWWNGNKNKDSDV